jgi:hypothetical protein
MGPSQFAPAQILSALCALAAMLHPCVSQASDLPSTDTCVFKIGFLQKQYTLCPGSPICAEEIKGRAVSYSWSTGSTENCAIASQSGMYRLVAENFWGCISEDSVYVQIAGGQEVASFQAAGRCQGKHLELVSTSKADTYQWFIDGLNFCNSQKCNIFLHHAGPLNISIETVSAQACFSRKDSVIEIHKSPKAAFSCNIYPQRNSTELISRSGAFSQQWQIAGKDTGSVPYIIINGLPDSSFKASLTVTNQYGCSASASIDISSCQEMPFGVPAQQIICPKGQTHISELSHRQWQTSGGRYLDAALGSQPSNTRLCLGDSLKAQLLVNSGFILWTDGAVGQSRPVSLAGQYKFFAADSNGCGLVSKPITAEISSPIRKGAMPAAAQICAGQCLELDSLLADGARIEWDFASSGPCVLPPGPGTYSYTATGIDRCSYKGAINLSVEGFAPAVKIIEPELCANTRMQFAAEIFLAQADNLESVKWYKNGLYVYSGQVYPAVFDTAGQINLRAEAATAHNCLAASEITVSIKDNPLPVFSASGGDKHCLGSVVEFNADTCYKDANYRWSFGAEGCSASAVFLKEGKVKVMLQAASSNGCLASSSRYIFLQQELEDVKPPTITYPPHVYQTYLQEIPFSWQADSMVRHYSFHIGTDPSMRAAFVLDSLDYSSLEMQLPAAGTYFWQLAAHNYCGDTKASPPQMLTKLDIEELEPDLHICSEELDMPTGTGIAHWQWQGHIFGTNGAQPIASVSGAALGGARYMQFNGGSSLSCGCQLESLNKKQTAYFLAYLGHADASHICLPGCSGGISAANVQQGLEICSGNLCAIFDTIISGWSLIGVESCGADIILSINGQKILKHGSPYPDTYSSGAYLGGCLWNAPGSIAGLAEAALFCRQLEADEHQSIADYFQGRYSPALRLPDTLRSTGFGLVNIGAPQGFAKYIWNGRPGGSQITAPASGMYRLKVTDYAGRAYSDSVYVQYPVAGLLQDTSLCEGDTLVWSAGLGPGYKYRWMRNGKVLHSASSSIGIYMQGVYELEIEDPAGLLFRSPPATVRFIALKESLGLGPDREICSGGVLEPAKLPAGTKSYRWSCGSEQPWLSIAQPGLYSLTVTDINGCRDSASVRLQVSKNKISAALSNRYFCFGDTARTSIVLRNGQAPGSANWQIGDNIGYGADVVISPRDTGWHFFEASAVHGKCAARFADSIYIHPLPEIMLAAAKSYGKVCAGREIEIKAAGSKLEQVKYNYPGALCTETTDGINCTFWSPGSYSISAEAVSHNGCTAKADYLLSVSDSADIASVPEIGGGICGSVVASGGIIKWTGSKGCFYKILITGGTGYSYMQDSISTDYYILPDMPTGQYAAIIESSTACGIKTASKPCIFYVFDISSHAIFDFGASHNSPATEITGSIAASGSMLQPDYAYRPASKTIGGHAAFSFSDGAYMYGLPEINTTGAEALLVAAMPSKGFTHISALFDSGEEDAGFILWHNHAGNFYVLQQGDTAHSIFPEEGRQHTIAALILGGSLQMCCGNTSQPANAPYDIYRPGLKSHSIARPLTGNRASYSGDILRISLLANLPPFISCELLCQYLQQLYPPAGD